MNLAEYLFTVAVGYDRTEGLSSPTQLLLRGASQHIDEHVPGGIVVRGSGGQGNTAQIPWVAFLDPDETETPTEGVYLVYLFSSDLERVYLSLNQGVSKLREDFGIPEARARLAHKATQIRSRLSAQLVSGLDDTIDLGGSGWLPSAYEAGNIAARRYLTGSLPEESELRADLQLLLASYQNEVVHRHQPDTTFRTPQAPPPSWNPSPGFVFSDDSEYVAHIKAHTQVKTRRHETILNNYAEWTNATPGMHASNKEHPIDLVLRRGVQEEWLVEVKVVYRGDATRAVRDALSQLLWYKHFLYLRNGKDAPTGLMALFSDPVGGPFVNFLETWGVASVWKQGTGWKGSPLALQAGLGE